MLFSAARAVRSATGVLTNYDNIFGKAHGCHAERREFLRQALATEGTPPLMRENPIGDAVQPRKSLITGWDLVRFSPGNKEGVGNNVLHRVRVSPATTVGVHVTVEAVVDFEKASVATCQFNPSHWARPFVYARPG